MTLQELITEIKKLSPHDIVQCSMDCFDPYSYIVLPKALARAWGSLSEEDREQYEEWEYEQLANLKCSGQWT